MADTPIPESRYSRNDPRYMFAGPQAETSDLLLFNRAREMEKKRNSAYTIFQQTGWIRGVDGKWRFEISDHDAKLKIGIPNEVMDDALNRVYFEAEFSTEPSGLIKASYRKDTPEYLAAFGKTREEAADSLIKHLAQREYTGIRDIQQIIGQPLRLDELLHHPALFAAYPNLRETTVLFDLSLPDTVGGEFSWADGIRLNPNHGQGNLLSTIIHEIQHAIQEAEGFAYGGQPEERFASSIKRHLKSLTDDMQERVAYWAETNWDLLDEERATADMLTYGMMYQSMRRLREYANKDRPSGVLRLIRNEMGWWYHDKVRSSEHRHRADELERNWYNLPKRHRMQARNRFLREQCAEAADILSDLIPAPIQKQFREDERQLKSILRSLDKAADQARQATQPLRELKNQSKVARALKERHHYHSPFQIYQSLAGEIEARNAEARLTLTPEERRQTHPEATADIPQDDAIVIFRNGRGFDVEVPFRTASVAEATQTETPANRRARELVAQYPGQSDAELEAAFEAATDEGDDVLLALILRYRSEQTARDKAGELFSGFADFYTDSANPLLAAIAEATVRQRDGQDIRISLLERQQGDLTGIQVTNAAGTQGGIFLPDASEPGRVRVSYFDQQGFYGHVTRDNYEAVLEEAWRSGLNRETSGLLEQWMNLDSFREGNEVTSLIAQVNRGEISHREYLDQAQAIAEQRDRANAVVVLRNSGGETVTAAYRPDSLTPKASQIPFARTQKALTKEQAQYISDSLMLDWQERPDITVVNRVSELPQALQRDIWKNDAASDVRAAYWKNTVFVIAPRIADRNTLEEVLLHEIVGHYGLRVLLGDHLEPTLERIYQDMGNDAIAEQIKALYFGNPPFDAGNPAHRQLVAEEMMAKLAESGEYRALSEWERFEAQTRNGLRQMGFQLPLNKSDLLNILHGAEQVVRHGGLSRQSDSERIAELRYSFAGQNAATADRYALARAEQMMQQGVSPEVIRQQTGWFTGDDGLWRFEIDDSQAQWAVSYMDASYIRDLSYSDGQEGVALGEILNHERLFEAYPNLANLRVVTTESGDTLTHGLRGGTDGTFTVFLAPGSPREMLSTLLHEIQHGIQTLEGFAVGGSAELGEELIRRGLHQSSEDADDTNDLTAHQAYQRLSGEIEARNVQTRQGLTGEERRSSSPDATRDTPASKAIVVMGGQDMLSAPAPANARTPTPRPLTDTPAFRQWFGNSKVVGSNGEPLVLYHGTARAFNAFDTTYGAFFTPDEGHAYFHAQMRQEDALNENPELTEDDIEPQVIPVHLSFQNPMVLDTDHLPKTAYLGNYEQQIEQAKQQGFDSLIVENSEGGTEYVAFYPEQIKLATGNLGTFDAENPDIRYKRAYHGTPYAFDRFSLEAIGTGEGAQAYGWGLYFASSKKLAQWYQNNLASDYTEPEFRVNGQLVDPGNNRHLRTALYEAAEHGSEKAYQSMRALADQLIEQGETLTQDTLKTLRALQSLQGKTVTEQSGYLYQVTLPEDDEFLVWENPLTDQPSHVIDAIKASGILEKTGNEPWSVSGHMMDGNALYESVRQWMVYEDAGWAEIGKTPDDVMNVSQAASEYLNRIGIPGLRYLDAPSRKADLSQDERKYNYVVWDENVVTIEAVNEEVRQAEAEARLSRAYHGSPFTFTRFDSQFIGAGEGNQAYGHGLYFAGRQAVAEHYQRNTLPDYWQSTPDDLTWDASGASETARHLLATLPIDKAIAAASVFADQIGPEYGQAATELREIQNRGPVNDAGNLYEVEIPDDHHLMDWDASLKDQPPAIMGALMSIGDAYLQEVLTTEPVPSPDGEYWSFMGDTYATAEDALNDHTPEDLIRGRRGRLGDSPKAISDTLNKAGIPGLRYLDAQSRFGTLDSHTLSSDRSHNYVIWDDRVVSIQAIHEQTAPIGLPEVYEDNQVRYSRPTRTDNTQTEAKSGWGLTLFSQDELNALYQANEIEVNGERFAPDIPSSDTLMHWDKPLHQQSEAVQGAMRTAYQHLKANRHPIASTAEERWTNGKALYTALSQLEGSPRAASDYLNRLGVPGIQMDGTGATKGTPRYTVWDDAVVSVTDIAEQQGAPQTPDGVPQAPGKADNIIHAAERFLNQQSEADRKALHEKILFVYRQEITPKLAWFDRENPEGDTSSLSDLWASYTDTLDSPHHRIADERDLTFSELADQYRKDIESALQASGVKGESTETVIRFTGAMTDELPAFLSAIGKLETAPDTLKNKASRAMDCLNAQTWPFGPLNKTETPAFKQWFGRSQVTTTTGKPKVVYHATNNDFTRFDPERGAGVAGQGIYMTDTRPTDDSYGLFVMPLYAAIENPADFRAGDSSISDMAETFGMKRLADIRGIPEMRLWTQTFRLNMLRAGYDGALLRSPQDGKTYYVAYNSHQVKSALGNNGLFSRASDDIRYSRAPAAPATQAERESHDYPPVRSADDLCRAAVSEAKAELAARERQIMAAYEAGHYTKAEILDAELAELYDELEHRLADLEVNGGTLSVKNPAATDSPLHRLLERGQGDDPDSEADLLGVLANTYRDYIDPHHWIDRDSTLTNARANIENLGGSTAGVSDEAIMDMLKDAYDHYGKHRTAARKGTLPAFKNLITETTMIKQHPEQAEGLLDKLDNEHLEMLLFEEAGIRASGLNRDNLIRLAMEHHLYEVENEFYNELIRTAINRYEAGTDSLPEAARNLQNMLSKGAFGYDKAAVEGILDASAQMNQRANETAKHPEPAPLNPEDKQKQFLYMEIRDYEERLFEAEALRSDNEVAWLKETRECTRALNQLRTELSMLQAGMTVEEIDQQTSPAIRPASSERESVKPEASSPTSNAANLKKVLQMSAFQKKKLAEQKSGPESTPEKKEEPDEGLHP